MTVLKKALGSVRTPSPKTQAGWMIDFIMMLTAGKGLRYGQGSNEPQQMSEMLEQMKHQAREVVTKNTSIRACTFCFTCPLWYDLFAKAELFADRVTSPCNASSKGHIKEASTPELCQKVRSVEDFHLISSGHKAPLSFFQQHCTHKIKCFRFQTNSIQVHAYKPIKVKPGKF